MRESVQLALQGEAVGECVDEARRRYSQGGSSGLHHGANRRSVDAESQRYSDCAFVADQPGFHAPLTRCPRQQADHAIDGKIDIPNRRTWFVEHITELERDRLEFGQEPLILRARQSLQHGIGCRCLNRCPPACRGCTNCSHPQRASSRGKHDDVGVAIVDDRVDLACLDGLLFGSAPGQPTKHLAQPGRSRPDPCPAKGAVI